MLITTTTLRSKSINSINKEASYNNNNRNSGSQDC